MNEDAAVPAPAPAGAGPIDASDKPRGQRKREKHDVHGWVVLDKPVGMTSTHAVSVIKRLFQAKRAGHAGTLDPLASGCLPVALGEATKTVPFVMDGQKTYLFTVRWGEERDTDDAEGRVVATSDERPGVGAIQAVLAPTDDAERQKAIDAGHDLDRVLQTEDLVSGENVFFSATGVTDGDLLQGVRYFGGGCTTQSIVMRSKSGTVRMIDAYHRLSKLNEYSAVDFTGDLSAAHPLP